MKLSVFLAMLGLFVAIIYPMFKTETSDVDLASVLVYGRGDSLGWMTKNMDLDAANNPTRLKVTAMFLPGTPYLESIVRFNVLIVGQEGIVLNKPVQVRVGKYLRAGDGSVTTFTHVPQFSIPKSGSYTISVRMDEKPDFSLSSVSVTELKRVAVPDTSLRTHGVVAVAIGMILFFRARKRRRKKEPKNVETTSSKVEAPKPVEKPAKKKIRWGRNANPD